MKNKTLIIAHRGASAYAPENTIPAFKKAIEMSADGIELDVHLSKDGHLVVVHDENIERVSNGKGFVKDYSLKELKQFDFGSWFGQQFIHTSMPTLKEVMDLIKNWDGILNIELKTGVFTYEGIEKKCLELIKQYHFEEKVIFSSFNHYSIRNVKKLDKNIKVGLLYGENLYKPYDYAKTVDAEALHPYFHTVDEKMIKKCKNNDVMINTWTVNEEKDIEFFVKHGIHGIITNKPDIAIGIRKGIYNNK